MFVDKSTIFQPGETVGFKLVTGEEIIGKVIDITNEELRIEKPCTLGMAQNGGLGLSPASYMADMEKPVTYSKAHIVAWFIPHADLEAGYRSATGGIQVPPKGVIMPTTR